MYRDREMSAMITDWVTDPLRWFCNTERVQHGLPGGSSVAYYSN